MRDCSKNLYRLLGRAVLTGGDGTKTPCRGAVVRRKAQAGDYASGLPHETGELCRPLYVFTGGLDSAQPGDVLEQDGVEYTVLGAEPLALGPMRLGLRLVMERRPEHEGE